MARMNTLEAILAASFAEREAAEAGRRFVSGMEEVRRDMEQQMSREVESSAEEASRDHAMARLIDRGDRIQTEYEAHVARIAPLSAFREKASRLADRGVEEVDLPEDIALQVLSCADDLVHSMAAFIVEDADPLLRAQLVSLAPADMRDGIRSAFGIA